MAYKSLSYYIDVDKDLQQYFDSRDAYELLEWAAALSQLALDARNAELARPLDLKILDIDDTKIPY